MPDKLNIIPLFCKKILRSTFSKIASKFGKVRQFIKMKFIRSHKSGKWPFPSKNFKCVFANNAVRIHFTKKFIKPKLKWIWRRKSLILYKNSKFAAVSDLFWDFRGFFGVFLFSRISSELFSFLRKFAQKVTCTAYQAHLGDQVPKGICWKAMEGS